MQDEKDWPLTHLLDSVDHAARGATVSLDNVLEEFGERAITPFILIIAVLLVSPVSGIPGVPTVSAIVIVILSSQALFGRRRLWLPHWLKDRKLPSTRVRTAVSWMRKPCAFLDRHSRPRLLLLTEGPMRWITLLVCVVIPMGWPLLEVLPFVTSIGAGTVSLLAFGLLTRDGIYVLAGYLMVGITAGAAVFFLF